MNKGYTILIAIIIASNLFGQSPDKMSYQAVIRNDKNELVVNTNIGIQISILQGTIGGFPVYTETQSPSTNSNGLVSIEIGVGNTSDNFALIDWANGPYFIKTETDPEGGSNYTIIGVSQLLSVPYAKYADHAGNAFSGSFNDLSDLPVNLDTDNTDDFDGAFSSLTSIPTGLSDGDDNTQLDETAVDAFVSNNGYLTSEVDGSISNELQLISISNDTIYLSDGGFVKLPAGTSFSGSFNDLSDLPVNLDTDNTDDFDGAFSSLTGIPTGLSDGDDNTQLDETAVDAFVSNNGYLTSEVDGSISNELQLISISNDTIYLSDGGFVKLPAGTSFSGSFNDLSDLPVNLDTDNTDDFDGAFSSLTGIPTGLSDGDDNTQLDETAVDAFVSNNGYLTSEVDGSVTNEIELPTQTGNSGKYLTTNGTSPSWATVTSGGMLVTSISTNTTISTEEQLVIITGSITVTLPASPGTGQIVTLITNDDTAIINLNGGIVNQGGIDYTTNDTFATYGNSLVRILVYSGTKWYVLN